MKLIFIHGIAQEGFSPDELHEAWCRLIKDRDPKLLDGLDVQMAYYGKELASWTKGGTGGIVPMGVDAGKQDEVDFMGAALMQAAVNQGCATSAIDNTAQAVPMDSWLGRRLVAAARALEELSPLKGKLALQVIKQAYTYLSNPKAREAVDGLVRPHLIGERVIIVSHSLGTVVAFRLLREIMQKSAHPPKVPLLITMGSPLGLDAVKAKLGTPRVKPAFVKRWVNFYDRSDFVALGKDLNKDTFAEGIENVGNVNNTTSNAHGIAGYLPDARVIKALKDGLSDR